MGEKFTPILAYENKDCGDMIYVNPTSILACNLMKDLGKTNVNPKYDRWGKTNINPTHKIGVVRAM